MQGTAGAAGLHHLFTFLPATIAGLFLPSRRYAGPRRGPKANQKPSG